MDLKNTVLKQKLLQRQNHSGNLKIRTMQTNGLTHFQIIYYESIVII